MAPIRSNKPTTPPLQKGQACSSCKARKVKCDAVHPACGSCQRTARFEGRDPSEVVCTYGAGRRCGARKSRAKGASPVTDDSTTSQPQAAALPALPETQENFYVSAPLQLPATLPPLPSPPTTYPSIPLTALPPLPFPPASTSTSPIADAAYPRYSAPPPPPPFVTAPLTALDYTSWGSYSAELNASLGSAPSLWTPAFEDSSSPSSIASPHSHTSLFDGHLDHLTASPDSLHSTWSDFALDSSEWPTTSAPQDEFAYFTSGMGKCDETLSLPLFPLSLPEVNSTWMGGMPWGETSGFGTGSWSAMA